MNKERCLGCYETLEDAASSSHYHVKCSRKLFKTTMPPTVNFGIEQIEGLALEALNKHLGITGVQPKISVDLENRKDDSTHRLMIVGLWGNFILKPPTRRFPDMAVVEDATMHMATAAGIPTASHGLVKLNSGEYSYITRRFDRIKNGKKIQKIAVEDFCQLRGLLTEQKYKSSMEKAGKVILEYASNPGLDAVTFFDIALFSFLTGNADMHLKNFSLMRKHDGEIGLTPAYDLIATKLMPINDPEEMALTVNGKKTHIRRKDFKAMAATLKIQEKAVEHSFQRLHDALPSMLSIIEKSFLSTKLKERFAELIAARSKTLGI